MYGMWIVRATDSEPKNAASAGSLRVSLSFFLSLPELLVSFRRGIYHWRLIAASDAFKLNERLSGQNGMDKTIRISCTFGPVHSNFQAGYPFKHAQAWKGLQCATKDNLHQFAPKCWSTANRWGTSSSQFDWIQRGVGRWLSHAIVALISPWSGHIGNPSCILWFLNVSFVFEPVHPTGEISLIPWPWTMVRSRYEL